MDNLLRYGCWVNETLICIAHNPGYTGILCAIFIIITLMVYYLWDRWQYPCFDVDWGFTLPIPIKETRFMAGFFVSMKRREDNEYTRTYSAHVLYLYESGRARAFFFLVKTEK